MSRFGDAEWDEQWRARLYEVDLRRALLTKPALQALTELRDALRALPEPRLALGAACRVPWGEDDERDYSKPTFCAMGAWLFSKKVAAGQEPRRVVELLADSAYSDEDYGYETIENIKDLAKTLGMSRMLAGHIQWVNDEQGRGSETDEERYTRVLAWVEDKIRVNVAERERRLATARG